MTVSEDLAVRLRGVRGRLDDLDAQRETVVEERDQLVVRARDEGGSLREIAELLGITHAAVRKIADRTTED